MAQYNPKDLSNTPKKSPCIFCDSKDNLNIFWVGKKDFYICDDCHGTVKGIFADVLRETKEKTGNSYQEQLKVILEHILNTDKLREENKKNI